MTISTPVKGINTYGHVLTLYKEILYELNYALISQTISAVQACFIEREVQG